ncbi:hypothetical protein, partial [Escherichia coli]|uniref:hypothetical protein n=1 Tax=Escherichia coli TaxID=562 RepID=UPI003BA15916
HLARLDSPWPRTLDLYLDSPDPLLPDLLAEPVVAILPRQMGEQRAIPQGQQTLHHILHHQFAAVVKAHRRAQVETPVAGA